MTYTEIKGDRYYVFVYYDYYPVGGMSDCVMITDDFEEAVDRLNQELSDTFQPDNLKIYDSCEKKIVYTKIKGER